MPRAAVSRPSKGWRSRVVRRCGSAELVLDTVGEACGRPRGSVVSRARASQLLHRFHAQPVGSQLVLDRLALIRSLRAIRRGRPAQAAAARRTHVATELRKARLEAVRVPVAREVLQTEVAVLPAGIALGPGQIELRFDSVPEALQNLFTLAQAITNDYDRFAAMVRTDANRAVGESTP